jgi:small subunit ribosomal protein S20
MPITKGAKKALRASERKAVFNLRRKRVLKTEVKNIKDLIKEGKVAEAQKSLPAAYKALDKAAKMNSITKNHASRKKSRLAKAIKKASAK